MLDALRQGSKNIFFKTLMIIIVLSFVVWGVGDMFRGRSSSEVAEIGNSGISMETYDKALRQEIRRIQAMTGGAVTTEQIMAMQVDRMVLNQLINQHLIALETRKLGINVGSDLVLKQVMADPNFQDSDGNFDKDKFLMLLSSNNLTEKKLVQLVSSGIESDILIDGLTASPLYVDSVAQTLYAYRNEQRKIDLLTLTKDNVSTNTLPSPSDTALMEYYEKHKSDYAVPEYRSISYIVMNNDDVVNSIEIDEAELLAIYESQQELYQAPERREVDNITFETEEQAKQAYERLKADEDFYVVAKEITGNDRNDVDMGFITRDGLSSDLSDVIFALNQNTFSEPVQGPFGWYIFRVKEIKPASEKTFEEARKEIEAQYKSEQAVDVLTQEVNDIEDAFASGSTLEEVAKTFNLTVKTTAPMDTNGLDKNSSEIEDLPDAATLVKLAFDTNENEISPLTITSDNTSYVAVHVKSVTDPRVKALDEVSGLVQQAWAKDRHMQELKKMAQNLAERLKSGTSWQDATGELNVKIETGKLISRNDNSSLALPDGLKQEIFLRNNGEHTEAYENDGAYSIALVRSTIKAPKDIKKLNAIKLDISSGSVNDLLEQYNVHLRKRYPVSINESMLKRTEL